MLKNRRGVACIIALSLLVGLGFSIIIYNSNSSKAEKINVKTGEDDLTIEEYEMDGKSTYIGYGFNVAKKGDIRADQLVINPIFNLDNSAEAENNSIRDTSIKVDDISSYTSNYYQGSTIDEVVKNQALDMNKVARVLAKSSWIPFSASYLNSVFAGFEKSSVSKNVSEYTRDIRTVETNSISWTLNEEEYYNYLTNSFKKEVMTMEPSKLFDKYGTHFLRSVTMGGKLEINSSIKASGKTELETINKIYRKSLGNEDCPDKIEIVKDYSANADIDITYQSVGGIGTDFRESFNKLSKEILNYNGNESTLYNLTLDSAYKVWLQSVDRQPALIDVSDSNSLYPIWELVKYFPQNDSSISEKEANKRMEELENAFDEYGKAQYDKAVAKYNKKLEKLKPAKVDTELTGIKYANFYNKDRKLSEKNAKVHEGYRLGELVVTNAKKNDDGQYSLKSGKIAIEYNIQQDLYNLPVGTSNFKKHYLVADYNFLKVVNGYGKVFNKLKDSYVGKGAYFVQVVYADQTTESFSAKNIFKNKENGENVTLLTVDSKTIDAHNGIDKVKVLMLYETSAYRNVMVPYVFDWMEESVIDFR